MEGQAFDFIHPQYGKLRIIRTVDGNFYFLRDVMRIYDKSGKEVFETLADSNGRIAQFLIVMAPCEKSQKRPLFLTDEEMGWGTRRQKNKNTDEIFVDEETLRDLEQQLYADGKWGKRWIHEFVEPIIADTQLAEQYRSLGIVDICCPPPTLEPIDISYSESYGLGINYCFFGK